MACELESQVYEDAIDQLDAAMIFYESIEAELQQALWAVQAAQAQATAAFLLLDNCLNQQQGGGGPGQGGPGVMRLSFDRVKEASEKVREHIAERRQKLVK